jgi:hypothetical protein
MKEFSYINHSLYPYIQTDIYKTPQSILIPSRKLHYYRHSYIPARDIKSSFYSTNHFWCKFPNYYEKSY